MKQLGFQVVAFKKVMKGHYDHPAEFSQIEIAEGLPVLPLSEKDIDFSYIQQNKGNKQNDNTQVANYLKDVIKDFKPVSERDNPDYRVDFNVLTNTEEFRERAKESFMIQGKFKENMLLKSFDDNILVNNKNIDLCINEYNTNEESIYDNQFNEEDVDIGDKVSNDIYVDFFCLLRNFTDILPNINLMLACSNLYMI